MPRTVYNKPCRPSPKVGPRPVPRLPGVSSCARPAVIGSSTKASCPLPQGQDTITNLGHQIRDLLAPRGHAVNGVWRTATKTSYCRPCRPSPRPIHYFRLHDFGSPTERWLDNRRLRCCLHGVMPLQALLALLSQTHWSTHWTCKLPQHAVLLRG